MNAERLKEIVEFLLGAEKKNKLQDRLNALRDAVNSLAGNPNEQNLQRTAAEKLTDLENGVNKFVDTLTPAARRNIVEIKGFSFFSKEMVTEISATFAKSGMTPAVLQSQLQKFVDERTAYLATLEATRANLDKIGIKIDTLSPGQAEIGFQIPRELFGNDLSGFQNELKTLNTIIRTFYEISNLTPGPVELRQISASDPIIFLGMDITVLVHVGPAIKWSIETIKASLDVKKIVESARTASIDPTVVAALESQITAKIDQCVEAKVAELLENYQGDPGRKNELRGPLQTSLEQILQRVERGMTVEIRFIPPPRAATTTPDAGPTPEQQKFDELGAIAKTLDFPQIPGQPTLQLTTDEPDTAQQ